MIDLSQKAAREIGMLQKGLQQVELIILPFNLGSEKSTGENDLETE
jgi:rare lipoprotein A (peptidoglycan hydrolase)